MEHHDLMRLLAETLERLELRYLITGSSTTITYGEPRLTNDIDVVVELPLSKIDSLIAAFPDGDYYVSRSAAIEAVQRRRQFNIIHPGSGLKVDVIVASNSEFDRERFSRGRNLFVFADRSIVFASPEDVILKKMEYFKEGRSEKHLRDISGVLMRQREKIDTQYISSWAIKLGLSEIWQAIQSEVQP